MTESGLGREILDGGPETNGTGKSYLDDTCDDLLGRLTSLDLASLDERIASLQKLRTAAATIQGVNVDSPDVPVQPGMPPPRPAGKPVASVSRAPEAKRDDPRPSNLDGKTYPHPSSDSLLKCLQACAAGPKRVVEIMNLTGLSSATVFKVIANNKPLFYKNPDNMRNPYQLTTAGEKARETEG